MGDKKEMWREMWDDSAQTKDAFGQMGRSNFTMQAFFILVKDIIKGLEFEKTDTVLDIGCASGWVSLYIAPLVKEVVMCDYAENMVSNAIENSKFHDNVKVFRDDILTLKNVGVYQYDKIIVGSVLQYLEDKNQIYTAIENMYKVLKPGGKALLTQNPDLRRKEAHIKSYDRLDWDEERLKKGLEIEALRLWLDVDEMIEMAKKIGFREGVEQKGDESLWQSNHMFNVMLIK